MDSKKCLFLLFLPFSLQAQFSSKLIDEETQKTIPFATIQLINANAATVSNEEGEFSIHINGNDIDSLLISCMGYETKTIAIPNFKDSTILLKPKIFELNSVLVSNKIFTADEIVENVIDNFEKNHHEPYAKKRVFIRDSYHQFLDDIDYKIKKSTIDEINEELVNSIINIIPENNTYFNETLMDLYQDTEDEEIKVKIIKTLWLEEKLQSSSFENIEDTIMDILKRNTKKGSYLKLKSGIMPLGGKLQLDSIINDKKVETEKQKTDNRQHYFNYKKWSVNNFLKTVIGLDNTEIDVIRKKGRYEFKIEDYVDIDNKLAYVISFYPERNADFKGKLYINTDDFAILRVDVESAQQVFDKKFNMLGIHYNKLTYKATLFFSKDNDKYQIKYIRKQAKDAFSIDRPFKIIEKNKIVKGRRKQNEMAFDLKLKMSSTTTNEAIFFNNETLSDKAFEGYKEDIDFEIDRSAKYDPEYWNGHNIIAPEKAIKDFDVAQ